MTKRLKIIRRKALLNADIGNSTLTTLSQRNEYFKNRKGDTSLFNAEDTLLVFIADELSNFLPFRNVSGVVNDLAKNYPNLYGLLTKNPKQYLVVETIQTEVLPDLNLGEFVTYPILAESLKLLDWENRHSMVLLNLEKVFREIEQLFDEEGLKIN